MKNKLIAAFLMLTAVSGFAASFASAMADKQQQVSKEELLAHLKKAKAESLYILYNNKRDIKKILKGEIDWSQAGFDVMINIWNDLFNAVDPEQKQFDADATTCLNLLCEKQDSIENIFHEIPHNGMGKIVTTIGEVLTSENKDLSNKEIKNNYKAVSLVFIKYTRWPWYKYFNDYLNDPVLAEDMESALICGDFFCIGAITIYPTRVLDKLLPKLDAKIAELEAEIRYRF